MRRQPSVGDYSFKFDWFTIGRILEIFLLRGMPAAINLASLILISSRLSIEAFAFYSTAIASTSYLALVLFGAVNNLIVPRFAFYQARGERAKFEGFLLVPALFGAVLALLSTLISIKFGLLVSLVVGSGALLTFQELLRAKMKVVLFSVTALAQAGLFLTLIYLFVSFDTDPFRALVYYLIATIVALGISLACSGFPRPVWPDRIFFHEVYSIGASYTLGTAAQQGILLGVRYLTVAVASPAALAIVSFSLDLAQRVITFVISTTGFVFVPRAFEHDARGDEGQFSATLRTGARAATALAAIAIGAIVLIAQNPWLPILAGSPFDWLNFVVVALGVTVNRVAVISVDPLAMKFNRTMTIFLGYLISVLALVSIYLPLAAVDQIIAPAIAILFTYIVARTATILLLRRHGIRWKF